MESVKQSLWIGVSAASDLQSLTSGEGKSLDSSTHLERLLFIPQEAAVTVSVRANRNKTFRNKTFILVKSEWTAGMKTWKSETTKGDLKSNCDTRLVALPGFLLNQRIRSDRVAMVTGTGGNQRVLVLPEGFLSVENPAGPASGDQLPELL